MQIGRAADEMKKLSLNERISIEMAITIMEKERKRLAKKGTTSFMIGLGGQDAAVDMIEVLRMMVR